jgi:hypothetical protein
MSFWHLASGIWHLASGIWHLASGIWHLASGIWHPESAFSMTNPTPFDIQYGLENQGYKGFSHG